MCDEEMTSTKGKESLERFGESMTRDRIKKVKEVFNKC